MSTHRPDVTGAGYVEAATRREDVIEAAVDLLPGSEPASLTSVDVAARLGLTRSAIYRRIRDMDELTTLASDAILDELSSVVIAAVVAPQITWGDGGAHLNDASRRLVELISDQGATFSAIERWRHTEGHLGDGVRRLIDLGAKSIADELESQWRREFEFEDAFDDLTQAAQLVHAGLVIDDVIAAARRVNGADPSQRRLVEHILGSRLFAGWCGYVIEVNTRMGLALPQLGGPMLSPPGYSIT